MPTPPPNPRDAAKSGEAGQQGRDRQAQKNITDPDRSTPDPAKAATPPDAQSRSTEARKTPTPIDQPDYVHPGPGRYDLETSKGNLHHKQHEPQPDMQNEVEDL